jgi:transposase
MDTAQLQKKTKEELIEIFLSSCKDYEQTIESLRHQLNNALRHRFGVSSEKNTDSSAQGNLFDEAIEPDNQKEIEQAEEVITVPQHKRTKRGRKSLPKNLPRLPVVHDLDEEDKICSCGCTLQKIGEEITEQLDIVPAKVQVIENIKYKYACKQCGETIKTAKAPKQPIPGSIATAGTLSHVITSKFCDHLPLYRQEAIFQRMGVDIARNTLSNWVIKSAELLLPLYKLAQQNIIDHDIAYADETRVQVLKEPDRHAESQSYMWVFIGGHVSQKAVVFHYNASRAHTVIEDMLDDFSGFLHCDGFSGYDTYASDRNVELIACWMHCRRKFYDVAKGVKSGGLANKAVKLIAKLYKVEKNIKSLNLPLDKIAEYRIEHAKPILNKFRDFVTEHINKVLPKSPLGAALTYANNQWPKLIRYIDDGRLEIDNGLSERAIRPFAIGRKNYLFFNSISGVKAGEVLYSLIETCKVHKIEPYLYLHHVLEKIPAAHSMQELEQLMPYNIDRSLLKV